MLTLRQLIISPGLFCEVRRPAGRAVPESVTVNTSFSAEFIQIRRRGAGE